MELSSPAFRDGDPIPEQYGHTAENVSPPLEIADVPSEAESLVIVVDDPDAMEPAGTVWLHWLVWNVDPTRKRIPEDWSTDAATAVEGENDYGEVGYGGPDPPDREHAYRFRLFALDGSLDVPAGADRDRVERAMDGHVIETTTYEGTFAP
jgi:Raf kinase inhibitor-like YbhB/YbcL family protein